MSMKISSLLIKADSPFAEAIGITNTSAETTIISDKITEIVFLKGFLLFK